MEGRLYKQNNTDDKGKGKGSKGKKGKGDKDKGKGDYKGKKGEGKAKMMAAKARMEERRAKETPLKAKANGEEDRILNHHQEAETDHLLLHMEKTSQIAETGCKRAYAHTTKKVDVNTTTNQQNAIRKRAEK